MQSYYNSLMEENDEKILKSKLMKTDISGYIFSIFTHSFKPLNCLWNLSFDYIIIVCKSLVVYIVKCALYM